MTPSETTAPLNLVDVAHRRATTLAMRQPGSPERLDRDKALCRAVPLEEVQGAPAAERMSSRCHPA